MSSQDSSVPVERIGSSRKRTSTLNDHEDHLLRRRINTYQKIHDKEIAQVASQLEEIRDSMKALATDSLYGTQALSHTGVSHESSFKRPVTIQGRTSNLRRAQSFPELLGRSSDDNADANTLSFPALRYSTPPLKRFGETTAPKSRSIGSHFVDYSGQYGKEASNSQYNGHKKLERCKTAPVAMLQPLLKTTPEMVRKKIRISTAIKASTEEISTKTGVSRRFGDSSTTTPHASHLQTKQADGGIRFRRDIPYPDSPQFVAKQTSHSFYKSRLQDKPVVKAYPHNMVPAESEKNDALSVSLEAVKHQQHKVSLKSIYRPLYKLKHNLSKANDSNENEADETDDLRNCRYLRFTKESQESNRI